MKRKGKASWDIPGLTITRDTAGGSRVHRYVMQHEGQVILLGYEKSEHKAREVAARQLTMLNEFGEALQKAQAAARKLLEEGGPDVADR